MKLNVPAPAKKGDRVYIISPSAVILPFTENRTKRAIQHLETLGFEVVIAPNANKNMGYVSASIKDRVADIHAAFLDDKCSIIMAAIGGNHSNQLLSSLDYELIKKHPKIFVGYSDNTVLHLALATQANLQTFYGPCFLNQFGEYPEVLSYTLKHFESVIMRDQEPYEIKPSEKYTDEILDWFKGDDSQRSRVLQKNAGFEWWKKCEAEGWALPGALPSINHLIGTKYLPKVDGAILLIDIPEGHTMYEGQEVSGVDAWLTDIDNADIMSKLNGLVICRPYKYTPEMVAQLKEVVLRITDKYEFPILFNVDFGHTDPMITIPIGARMSLNSKLKRFYIS